MAQSELITLGVLFFFSIVGGLIASRFRQPAVIGLLVVGMIIGPYALNLVNDLNMINIMIEVGAALLMFLIGLEFSVSKLMKVGVKALIIGVFKVGILFFIGYNASLLLGLNTTASVFVGIIICFTSTIVVVKVLEQKNMFKRDEMPLLMAILIIEDVFTVLSLTLVTGLGRAGSAGLLATIEQIIIGAMIITIVYLVMQKFAERLIVWLMDNSGEDAIVFISLGLCAGFAYLGHVLLLCAGAGAFLAGSIVSSFRESKQFEKAILPYTLIFTSLFFIAIGTLINLPSAGQYVLIIAVLLGVVLVSRFIGVGLTSYVFTNFTGGQAFFSSIAMFSIGEFALLIAKESMHFDVGVDLVTISAILLVLSSIVMSLTVHHAHRIYPYFEDIFPKNLKAKFRKLSEYVTSLFEEVETESTTSNRLRHRAMQLLSLVAMSLAIAAGSAKLISLLAAFSAVWVLYLAYFVAAITCVTFLVFAYKKFKEVRHLSIAIMVNLDSSRSVHKAGVIFDKGVTACILIALGLFLPVVNIQYDIHFAMNIASAALILTGLWRFRAISRLVSGYTQEHRYGVPTYRKLDANAMRFKDE